MSVISKFEIKLEPNVYYYRPNDKINGELLIEPKSRLFLKNVRLVLVGVIQVFDNGFAINADNKQIVKHEKTVLFHCFDLVNTVGLLFIDSGEHNLPFQFKLPNEILSSFNGVYGQIQYYIEANLMKNAILKSDFIQRRVYFNVMSPSNLSVDEMRLSVGGKVDKTLRFLIFKTGAVRFSSHLDRKGFFVGDVIVVNYTVSNRSSVRVIPRATLYQMEKYFTSDETLFRNDEIKVCHSKAEAIEPLSVSSGVILLKIPFNLKVFSFETSLIRVEFKIHVTIDIPNSFDLHIDLPLLISNYVF